MYTSIGLGPTVYFEIANGSNICKGIIGTAIRANFSFGIPASTNFKPVTASQAENPICNWYKQIKISKKFKLYYIYYLLTLAVNKNTMIIFIDGNLTMFHNNL